MRKIGVIEFNGLCHIMHVNIPNDVSFVHLKNNFNIITIQDRRFKIAKYNDKTKNLIYKEIE